MNRKLSSLELPIWVRSTDPYRNVTTPRALASVCNRYRSICVMRPRDLLPTRETQVYFLFQSTNLQDIHNAVFDVLSCLMKFPAISPLITETVVRSLMTYAETFPDNELSARGLGLLVDIAVNVKDAISVRVCYYNVSFSNSSLLSSKTFAIIFPHYQISHCWLCSFVKLHTQR